jgi:hypothetical protein
MSNAQTIKDMNLIVVSIYQNLCARKGTTFFCDMQGNMQKKSYH